MVSIHYSQQPGPYILAEWTGNVKTLLTFGLTFLAHAGITIGTGYNITYIEELLG